MLLGDLDVTPIIDGRGVFQADQLLRHRGGSDLGHLGDNGRIELAMGAFLVRTGSRCILVDAGAGNLSSNGFETGRLLDGLAARGVMPTDVTDVVLTHLHFDHVGWATQKGDVVFTNATFRCHARDWDHFVAGPAPIEASVRKLGPISSRLELFDVDGSIAPGVDVQLAAGHTPGSIVVVLSGGGERVLLLGDAVHCAFELYDSEWESVFDVDPNLASVTRERLARAIEHDGTLATGAHFPALAFGRLIRAEGKRHWVMDNA